MVGVGNDVEDIAEEVEQILLVELIGNLRGRVGEVVDDLVRDYKSATRSPFKWRLTVETSVRNIPHGVLEGPDDRIDDQLELRRRKFEEC